MRHDRKHDVQRLPSVTVHDSTPLSWHVFFSTSGIVVCLTTLRNVTCLTTLGHVVYWTTLDHVVYWTTLGHMVYWTTLGHMVYWTTLGYVVCWITLSNVAYGPSAVFIFYEFQLSALEHTRVLYSFIVSDTTSWIAGLTTIQILGVS